MSGCIYLIMDNSAQYKFMKKGKLRVRIIEGCNFDDFPIGGTVSFLLNCLKTPSPGLDISLVGLATCKSEKVGKWSSRILGEYEYPFLPICLCDSESSQKLPLIPNRARMFLGMIKYHNMILKNVDVLYLHSPELVFPLFLWDTKVKIVLHNHGSPEVVAPKSRFKLIRQEPLPSFYKVGCKKALLRSSMIFWVSEEGFSRWSYLDRIRSKSIVIPTSVNTKIFYPRDRNKVRQAYGIPLENKVIVFLGRLNHVKRPELLLEAFHIFQKNTQNASLLYIGDGEMKPLLLRKAKELQLLEKITFFGNVEHGDLPPLISTADIGVLPSIFEGFPLSVLEMMACGVPVLASNVGDIPLIIKSYHNGLIFKTDSPYELSKNIGTLLSFAPNIRVNAINTANRYSSKSIWEAITTNLKSLVD